MKFNYEKEITIKGRITEVMLVNTETGECFVGHATCNNTDKFNANVGIAIANARANINRCNSEKFDLKSEKTRLQKQINELQQKVNQISEELWHKECEIDNRTNELCYLLDKD